MTMTRDQIERIRDGWAATGWLSEDDAIALFDYALSEQSRIDAAVAKERERCAEALLVWRDSIPTNAGGWYAGRRNGLESAAMMVRSMPAALPTPTTEEGA